MRTIDRVDYLGMRFKRLYRFLGKMSHLPYSKQQRKKEKRNEHKHSCLTAVLLWLNCYDAIKQNRVQIVKFVLH